MGSIQWWTSTAVGHYFSLSEEYAEDPNTALVCWSMDWGIDG
jgi:hypothetical protein